MFKSFIAVPRFPGLGPPAFPLVSAACQISPVGSGSPRRVMNLGRQLINDKQEDVSKTESYFSNSSGHFWTVVPELSDKQTLRRRNRTANRGGGRAKTNDSIIQDAAAAREEATSSGSGETSPSPSQPSISPPSDLPKPTASYGGMENILGNSYKAYGQSLLNAYLYQHGTFRSLKPCISV